MRFNTLTFALALAAAPGLAAAQPMAAPAAAPACGACHGPAGISPGAVTPNLAGQKSGYLAAQLGAFKRGERKHDLMTAIAGQLSDDDIQALAQYWSAQPAALPAGQAAAAAPIRSRAQLPADFPSGFTLYDTLDSAADGVVVRRWANAAALAAARAGRPLPAGSTIVVVNHARGADGRPGAAQGYSVMQSKAGWGDAVPALLRNGDWDYAVFGSDRVRNDGLNQAQCLACHRPVAGDSYVFTLKALKAAAPR